MSTVLVLDANQRSALSVTRSLGRAGVKVVCADVGSDTLAGASKFCAFSDSYPDPANAQAFIDRINELIERYSVEVLYPVTEITVYTLLEHVDKLKPVTLPFPTLDTVKSLSDKGSLVKLCQKLGLNVPASDYFNDLQDFEQNQKEYSFPVVLKPTLSRIKPDGVSSHGSDDFNGLGSDGWINTSVTYAHSREELVSLVSSMVYFRDYPFMIQEYIEGYGSGVFLLYNKGEYVAHFAHKRLREKPPSGGVSVLSESVEADPEQLSIAKQLLDAANWHGVAMVEFKVDQQGKPYVIEVNPRFWGSLQLAVDSGVDFPAMLHKIEMGQAIENSHGYTKGQKLRWLLGDLDRLYIVLKSRNYSVGEKLINIVGFLIPWSRKMRYEVNRSGDLKPFWYELKSYLRAE
ncbi:ATP-grasp domain-containing protein [Oleiphilus sp. HI0080]|uniref:carboxylate--amine ligase n=1 Tax=Oleiphilus sp. HI0080 TaxID=1822255 RepID=UPI0008398144|nr:ATP-grasp domain-containing protein [Oleiphilus sp. HI0080]